MPCYYPLNGYVSRTPNENGKYPIVFNTQEGWIDRKVQLPCGRCIGCRLERSRQWAVRCVHEASMWKENCFITLTFNDYNLPSNGSLDVKIFQKFMKRLRKEFGTGIRYFHCGEYGDSLKRPHYHACLFNFDFGDKKLWAIRDNVKLYRSESLEYLWPFGFSTIGDVTFESAAYVARYCTKKVNGKRAESHYKGLKPEYITMSRRPGIGSTWFNKWVDDVFPEDHVIVRGIECKPARYYDEKYCLTNEKEFALIKGNRERAARLNPDENRASRLTVREKVVLHNAANLRRSYEATGI
nr:MAG: replication initiator protein [Microviridae sp.]